MPAIWPRRRDGGRCQRSSRDVETADGASDLAEMSRRRTVPAIWPSLDADKFLNLLHRSDPVRIEREHFERESLCRLQSSHINLLLSLKCHSAFFLI